MNAPNAQVQTGRCGPAESETGGFHFGAGADTRPPRHLIGESGLFLTPVFRGFGLPFLKAVEHELDPRGYAELVKHTEKIVADRVLAEPQLLGNLPVRKPLGGSITVIHKRGLNKGPAWTVPGDINNKPRTAIRIDITGHRPGTRCDWRGNLIRKWNFERMSNSTSLCSPGFC